MTSVAVVILNYNGEKLLAKFLPSVIQYSKTARIVVVDNGSTDSSVEIIKQSFPNVELIQFEENYGFCTGYNKAIRQIEDEVVVLLNSDVEVTPGWLDSPINLLQSNSNLVAVQPKILSYQNKTQFEYAGAAGGFIDTLGYPFCRGRVFYTVENDEGQFSNQCRIFWASGACLIIKRGEFLDTGGFDDDFFAHMEEIDLCWRLNRAGYSIFYDGNSTVYHLGGGTLTTDSPRKVYYNFRNGLSLLVKNLSLSGLVFKLPLRIILDYGAAINFIFSGQPKSGLAVLKAHLASIMIIGKNLSKRAGYKHLGFKLPDNLVISKVIVFQYFIYSKRTYHEINNPR